MHFMFSVFFLSGMLFYLYRDKIKLDYRIFCLLLFLWAISFHTIYARGLFFIVFPYLILCFGFTRIPYLNTWGKYGDFSYGLYLFSFPIQQTLVHFVAPSLDPGRLFVLSLGTTLPVAVASWYAVESRALKLKKRLSNLATGTSRSLRPQ